jgi:energy-coupling factor transporter ATP-binding protein EcfA2
VIGLRSATIRYPGTAGPSLADATLDVVDGQVTGIAGASESGKTTLCLVLSGLIPRVVRATFSGDLTVDGEEVAALPMHALCGRVSVLTGPPDAMLSLVTDTVFEEVAFGPANLGLPREALVERAWSALATVRLRALAERDPRHLSMGQTQRLAIAAVLATGTTNLVLDEPAAHLDPDATARLIALLRDLAARGAAIVVASQDTRLLAAACDRAAVLADGRLGPVGAVADVLADRRIADAGLEPVDPSTGRAR